MLSGWTVLLPTIGLLKHVPSRCWQQEELFTCICWMGQVELSLLHVWFYTFSNQIYSLCDPMSTVCGLVSFVYFFSRFLSRIVLHCCNIVRVGTWVCTWEQTPSFVHPDFAQHALLNNMLSLTDLKKDSKLCRLSRRSSLPKLIRKHGSLHAFLGKGFTELGEHRGAFSQSLAHTQDSQNS